MIKVFAKYQFFRGPAKSCNKMKGGLHRTPCGTRYKGINSDTPGKQTLRHFWRITLPAIT